MKSGLPGRHNCDVFLADGTHEHRAVKVLILCRDWRPEYVGYVVCLWF